MQKGRERGMAAVLMQSGLEIVKSHQQYEAKIGELQDAIAKLADYGYTRSVIELQLAKLNEELKVLEATRFQAIEPVTVTKSSLGGHEYYVT